jgi:hypothetical protein
MGALANFPGLNPSAAESPKTSTTTTTDEEKKGTPWWVWLIVAMVILGIGAAAMAAK